MKKLIKSTLLITIIGAVIFGCSEDNKTEEVSPTLGGSFTVKGKSYELTKGFVVDEGGEYDIILTSSGISADPAGGDDLLGTGDLVSIIVISPSDTSFEPGTFTYDGSENKVKNTIEFSTAKINAKVESDTADVELKATGGSATVSLSGDIYTVTFNLTTSTDSFEGTYTGTLTELQD